MTPRRYYTLGFGLLALAAIALMLGAPAVGIAAGVLGTIALGAATAVRSR